MAASLPSFGGIASRLVHEGLISEAAMQKVLAESQQQKIAHLKQNRINEKNDGGITSWFWWHCIAISA